MVTARNHQQLKSDYKTKHFMRVTLAFQGHRKVKEMRGRKSKNNKELKNRKDPEKKKAEKEKESTGSLNTAHEEFI